MLNKLLEFLKNKRILILGVGMEGKSTYNFLRRNFPEKELFIADQDIKVLEKYPEFMEDMFLEVNVGENYLNGIQEYDLIIKSPGVCLKGIDISKFENKLTNQLELLLEFVPIFSIGVTGTKGKSTTSSILYEVLKNQEKDVVLLGNIGKPIFDSLDELKEESIAVLELSSHSLQYVKKSPNIAILLNVFEEHLDYYDSFKKYAEAKFNIFKFQTEKDYLIYNSDNPNMQNIKVKENDYAISIEKNPDKKNSVYIQDEEIICNSKKIMSTKMELKLKGMHNINNIMFVLAVIDILNLDFGKALKTIQNFKPLEHRCEFVAKIDSVEYYNDSIATIPEATINTIKSLKNVNTLIVGGKDRKVKLENLIKFLAESEIENVICLPKTGEYIYEGLKNVQNKNFFMVENLEEAVQIAKNYTKKNTICVLSPAASSYGFFKNFEERGKIYKKLVNNIKLTTK